MALRDVLISLNDIKTAGIIQDYAIGGGYAVMFYGVEMTTYDLDVLVVLANEEDYHFTGICHNSFICFICPKS